MPISKTTKTTATAALIAALVVTMPLAAHATEDAGEDIAAAITVEASAPDAPNDDSTAPNVSAMEPASDTGTSAADSTAVEPLGDDPAADEPAAVVPGPFTQVTRLQTNTPGLPVTIRSLDGGTLPIIDVDAYTLSDGEQAALDESCAEWNALQTGIDCREMLTTFGLDAARLPLRIIADRSVAHDALAAQIARGAAFDGSTARFVADGDGFVYLPGNLVEFEAEVAFTGTESDDPAAAWRTARFELLDAPTGEALAFAPDGSQMWAFSTGGFWAWFAEQTEPRFRAGFGGFQEEAAGDWGAGATLYVAASLVPAPTPNSDPTPVDPAPTPTQPIIPDVIVTGDEGPTLGGILGTALLVLQAALLPAVALRRRLANR